MATPFCFIFCFLRLFSVFSSRVSFLRFTISHGPSLWSARVSSVSVRSRRRDVVTTVAISLGMQDSGFRLGFSPFACTCLACLPVCLSMLYFLLNAMPKYLLDAIIHAFWMVNALFYTIAMPPHMHMPRILVFWCDECFLSPSCPQHLHMPCTCLLPWYMIVCMPWLDSFPFMLLPCLGY